MEAKRMSHPTEGEDLPLSTLPDEVAHFGWNDDYLELVAHRLGVAHARHVVDVGAGLSAFAGHLALFMRPKARLSAFDRHPEVVQAAKAALAGGVGSIEVVVAQAQPEALPLEDACADVVVAQRALSQVPDAKAVLREMWRVAKPGARLMVMEPHNLAQALVFGSEADSWEARFLGVRFQAHYEEGRRRLALGDDGVGDRLPAYFHELGLEEIEVRLSDQAGALVPPYDSPEKQARVEELRLWSESFEARADLLRRCVLAGGGSDEEFESYREAAHAQAARIREALDAGRYVHPGGMITYLVSGKKPLA